MDPTAITDDPDATGVPHAAVLAGFAQAVMRGTEDDAMRARAKVDNALGHDALVDACGVVAHFNMMTRMADGTGMPLDEQTVLVTETLRKEMDIERYTAAAHTPRLGFVRRAIGRIVTPLAPRVLRVMSWILNRGRAS